MLLLPAKKHYDFGFSLCAPYELKSVLVKGAAVVMGGRALSSESTEQPDVEQGLLLL